MAELNNKMTDEITLEELEEFIYVYFYRDEKKCRMQHCNLDNKRYLCNFKRMQILSIMFPHGLDKVELKNSSVHGNGVFAKQNISEGELITFYPADIVKEYPNKDGDVDGHIEFRIFSKRFDKEFGRTTDKKYINNAYCYNLNDTYSIIGSPYFKDDPNYLGQFINDGAKPTSDPKSINIYNKISRMKQNCRFQDLKENLHVAIVATKDILKGEELFICYNAGYWISHLKKQYD